MSDPTGAATCEHCGQQTNLLAKTPDTPGMVCARCLSDVVVGLAAERDRYRDAALAAVESLNEWREAPTGRQPGFKVLHARTLLLAALETQP
jgi:hypothetical protein